MMSIWTFDLQPLSRGRIRQGDAVAFTGGAFADLICAGDVIEWEAPSRPSHQQRSFRFALRR
jgi:hypothetical protein